MAREVSTEELARRIEDPGDRFALVDALPRASYVNRHIPGALSIPLEELSTRADQVLPDKDIEVIAYCSSPH